MKNPNDWTSRKGMGFLAVALVALGIWAAIIFISKAPVVSILLFVLIGGLGAFIGYKQKRARTTLFFGFWIASWGYSFYIIMIALDIPNAFFGDFFLIAFPIIALGTLPFAWFKRWETPPYSAGKNLFCHMANSFHCVNSVRLFGHMGL